jgi:hypothetical protein
VLGIGTEAEQVAGANYYRVLGRHIGIRDIPATGQAFAFPPNDRLPAALVRSLRAPPSTTSGAASVTAREHPPCARSKGRRPRP